MTTTRLELSRLLPGHPPQDDACVARLKEELSREDGVQTLQLELLPTGAALSVEHDGSVLSAAALEGAARRVGSEVQTRFKHETLQLGGLHCSDCANAIEGVTRRLDGVLEANATYATEKLRVTFDTTKANREQIAREVEGLGYRVQGGRAVSHRDNGTGVAETGATETGDEHEEGGHAHSGKVLGLPLGLFLSLLSGAALLLGWAGGRFFGLPFPVSLAFYLLAYAAGGYDATRHALRAARKRRFDIDVLMVVAAIGAASLGEWPEGALLLFLFSFGHALEHYAMDRARGAIRALAELAPKTARVRRDGLEQEVPTHSLRIGELVLVRAGERIPADGRVSEGSSAVDQAPITGESLPVEKEPGDPVFAGTINGDGYLGVETTKAPEDSTLARVIEMVEQAQVAKSPTQRFTERFERIFVPSTLVVTAAVIVLPPLFGFPFAESFIRAMTLLVAASPCALALGTPSAVLAGIARAARSGVLIKGGVHLENAGTAAVVAFDKTGTLTEGKPKVTDFYTPDGTPADEAELLARVAAAESRSTHPLAASLVREAEARGLELPAVDAFEALKGRGASASVAGVSLLIGNDRLMQENGVQPDADLQRRKEALEADGKTAMLIAVDGALKGLVAVRDEPREAAREAIATLKASGIKRTVMLTGDNRRVAEAIGRELGVDEVRAELLPEDKVSAIEELKERYGKVIMIGDGVNDAPAMVASTVGVAMGGAGTDVALETADIALMADNLARLPYAIELSRASRRMIQQNLLISLGVIALLVPSALFGLASIGVAIIFHEGSTLIVVLNALRLLGFKGRSTSPARPSLQSAPA